MWNLVQCQRCGLKRFFLDYLLRSKSLFGKDVDVKVFKFKSLVGKDVVVELKNDLSICGTLQCQRRDLTSFQKREHNLQGI